MHLIGIRREDKNPFERRVPLTPDHVAQLVREHGLSIVVQPSERRIFADADYVAAGATVREDLSGCPVVIGVKEIPTAQLHKDTTYLYFSHTIKGQPYNMGMLRRLLELGCTLMDYERIVDADNRRLVFFGRHAGLAGMIDSLWALGQRLSQGEGLETPLAGLRQAFGYSSLDQARSAIAEAGQALLQVGLPRALRPFVVGFAGYGNVSVGAQEIYDLWQPETIRPEELGQLEPGDGTRCYKVVFEEQHLVRRRQGAFELQHYYQHPEDYEPVFAEQHLPHLSMLINCIFWEPRFPRLVTLDDLRQLYAGERPRLRLISDISCDIEGSIEATVKATEPDAPVFVYDVARGEALDGVLGQGPVILAVDNLPAELPLDASQWFSQSLMPFMPGLASAKLQAPTVQQTALPEPLQRAAVVYRGALPPDYRYLEQHLGQGQEG